MIPKKVHFTWFSNDPFPELIRECMETWKIHFPDYEIVHWDIEKIRHIDNLFLKQALEMKKWAFASDFIRLYALYTEGGIYLDTDVEVYKSFDDLLHLKAFIGRENSHHEFGRRGVRFLTSHCMGAEKGNPYIKDCLDYYDGRPFILSHKEWLPDELRFDQTILPYIQMEIARMRGYNASDKIKGVQTLKDGLVIFPFDRFDCFYRTKNSYCRHLAMGGWRGRKLKTRDSQQRKIQVRAYDSLSKFLGLFNVVFFRKM